MRAGWGDGWMLFNSHVFIFGFLPLTLLLFYLLGRAGRGRPARAWLVFASLFFYGWWNPAYLPLILTSVLFNYSVGRGLSRSGHGPSRRNGLLFLGVAGNLAALAYFKYANFFAGNLSEVAGGGFELAPIVLPLAISFFTFQQIAYLVDAYRSGRGERSLLDYAIFVTFFPQLIAGPIVHHREMLPQFAREETYRYQRSNLEVGLTVFFIGLFKKVVLADGVALYATPVFQAAALGGAPGFFEAWGAALAYTFQLYFDFSGYSDMAIGLGRMFGLGLPLNFDSPYRAKSIIDFWRCWHMTLSRFLRDYLYLPLGGNRRGRVRRYLNLMITMLLGGLWHGAGWTFVVWGALHGVYLLLNHAWRALGERWGWGSTTGGPLASGAARLITFLAVVLGWVVFRAESMDAALTIYGAMAGRNGAAWPAGGLEQLGYLSLLLGVVWWAPNTQTFMSRFETSLTPSRERDRGPAWLRWRPTRGWAFVMALVTVWGILGINKYSEFLYFQF